MRHVQSLHEILEERVPAEEPQIQETENVGDDQFDVEVAYCDNIQMLDVNNQTLFIIDSYQAGDTELDTSVEDKDEVPWRVYAAHTLSTWGDNMWWFAGGVFMLHLQDDDLRLTAIYGLVIAASVIIFGASLGKWIDRTRRLTGTISNLSHS